jgi:hypothetical protein
MPGARPAGAKRPHHFSGVSVSWACDAKQWQDSGGVAGIAAHPPGKVQALQQRLEPGDLVGLGVHVGLGQDATAGVVDHCWFRGGRCRGGSCRRPRPPAATPVAVAVGWSVAVAVGWSVAVAVGWSVAVAAGRPASGRWPGPARRGRRGPARDAWWLRLVADRPGAAGHGGPPARPGPAGARQLPTRRSRPGTWLRPSTAATATASTGPQRVPSAASPSGGRRCWRGRRAACGTGRVPAQPGTPAAWRLWEWETMWEQARSSGVVMGLGTHMITGVPAWLTFTPDRSSPAYPDNPAHCRGPGLQPLSARIAGVTPGLHRRTWRPHACGSCRPA